MVGRNDNEDDPKPVMKVVPLPPRDDPQPDAEWQTHVRQLLEEASRLANEKGATSCAVVFQTHKGEIACSFVGDHVALLGMLEMTKLEIASSYFEFDDE